MTCERDLVELGGVVNFLPFGVGKKIVICLVPAADAGIERKMMCFIIIGGDVRHTEHDNFCTNIILPRKFFLKIFDLKMTPEN